jgi:hypothetical protein
MRFDNIYLEIALANFNLLWLALYVLAIRRGFRDKSFGIPMVALWFNINFDIIDTFILPAYPLQIGINLIYLALEMVILYQLVRFWRSDFPDLSACQFYVNLILSAVGSFALMMAFIHEVHDIPELRTAWVEVLINSALFVAMFYRRPQLLGQSIYIGLAKLVATAPLLVTFTRFPYPGFENSILLPVVYVGIFVLDLYYVILIYLRSRQLGINPWRENRKTQVVV